MGKLVNQILNETTSMSDKEVQEVLSKVKNIFKGGVIKRNLKRKHTSF